MKHLYLLPWWLRWSGFGSLAWEDPLGEHGKPLQSSCLENPMDIRAWRAVVHRVAQSQTQLSD